MKHIDNHLNKMENTIKSDKEGIVKQINYKVVDSINSNDPIINLS